MYSKTLAPLLVFISISCKSNDSEVKTTSLKQDHVENYADQNPYAEIAAIPIPAGFARPHDPENSFSYWLGDVFIRGGFPGHAVIVVDVVKNKDGLKKYLIAQSYMPAQDIHVLLNPSDENGSPWYDVNDDENIQTPEYTFYPFELKRW